MHLFKHSMCSGSPVYQWTEKSVSRVVEVESSAHRGLTVVKCSTRAPRRPGSCHFNIWNWLGCSYAFEFQRQTMAREAIHRATPVCQRGLSNRTACKQGRRKDSLDLVLASLPCGPARFLPPAVPLLPGRRLRSSRS